MLKLFTHYSVGSTSVTLSLLFHKMYHWYECKTNLSPHQSLLLLFLQLFYQEIWYRWKYQDILPSNRLHLHNVVETHHIQSTDHWSLYQLYHSHVKCEFLYITPNYFIVFIWYRISLNSNDFWAINRNLPKVKKLN